MHNVTGFPAGVATISRVREEEAIGRKKTFDLLTRTASKIEARSAGLPLAVQIAARPWNEHKIIAIIDKIHKDIEVKDLQRLYLAGIANCGTN